MNAERSSSGLASVLAEPMAAFLAHKRALGRRYSTEEKALRLLDRFLLDQQISGVKNADYSMRNSMLFFSIQLETKDLVEAVNRCLQLYHHIDQGTIMELEGTKVK